MYRCFSKLYDRKIDGSIVPELKENIENSSALQKKSEEEAKK